MSSDSIFEDIKNRPSELLKIEMWNLPSLGSLILLEILVLWVFIENSICGRSYRGKEGI